MKKVEGHYDFVSGLIAGLACSLVGALVTFVVMALRTHKGGKPPEKGNPFVQPLPSAPDSIPDWVLDESP